jgi:hypothetical protein
VIFEGVNFVIYDIVDLLPRHKNYPHGTDVIKPNGERAIPKHWSYGRRGSVPSKVFIHQTAGSYTPGFQGVYNTAAFVTRDPSYFEDGKWRGNGRGWPGMCYSYYIPFAPETTPDGKIIIFRCVPDEDKSWHTSGHNREAFAIGFQGYFKSRHMGRFIPRAGTNGRPSEAQLEALESSWNQYFKTTFNLTNNDVYGHFEAKRPKKPCPGDILERWVLGKRKGVEEPAEVFTPPVDVTTMVPLDSWKTRQAALLLLGFDLGSYGVAKNGVDGLPGYKTRAAIEGLEEMLGLEVNGMWDDRLEFMCQMLLFSQGIGQDEINDVLS